MYKDHTGREIKLGNRCEMDAGHSHCNDWEGFIVKEPDGSLSFQHQEAELGKVPVSECFSLLEVQ